MTNFIQHGDVTLFEGDCIQVMSSLPALVGNTLDMVLTDPPYGTTACKWDSIIPLDEMWAAIKPLMRANAAVVMTATQPFTTTLIASNMSRFKYTWIWKKNNVTGFVLAKRQPLRHCEDIVVFGDGQQTYNPQGLKLHNKVVTNSRSVGGASLKGTLLSSGRGSLETPGLKRVQEFTNYPRQILEFSRDKSKIHPTQKPVALMEYLIKTYTNEGDTVLDFTMGSGTTGVACQNTGRKFIGVERDPDYFKMACSRMGMS